MPSRSRTRSRPDVVAYYSQSYRNGTPTLYPTIMDYYKEDMSDFVTPDFYARIRRGDIISNPCNYIVHSLHTEGGGSYYAVVKTNPAQFYNGSGGSFTTYFLPVFGTTVWANEAPALDRVKMETLAKQQCLATVDSTPYEFGEDLGEIKETLQFLRNPVTAIKEVCKAFKSKQDDIIKKYPKSRQIGQETKDWLWTQRKRAEALASLWNQYRFALMPLIRSVMSALEAWNDASHSRPVRRMARRVEEDSSTVDKTFTYTIAPGSYLEVSRKGGQSYQVKTAIMYEVSNPLYDWKFKLGLRLKDLPKVGWALLPLSFMVDRVVDVSSSIGGLINLADPNVSLLTASVTKRDHREFDVRAMKQVHPTYNCTVNGDTVHTKYFTYERSNWQPGVLDTVPAFTPNYLVNDILKVLDLLSISITLMKGIGRV